jgi:hypothetical protein
METSTGELIAKLTNLSHQLAIELALTSQALCLKCGLASFTCQRLLNKTATHGTRHLILLGHLKALPTSAT